MILPEEIVTRFKDKVAAGLRTRCVSLVENANQGTTSYTYLGRTAEGREFFLKVGDPVLLKRTRAVSACCKGLDFVPAVLDDGSLEIDGKDILITELKSGISIAEPFRLTDGQFLSWVKGYLAFSERIQSLRPQAVASRLYGTAAEFRKKLEDAVGTSWLKRCILADLLSVARQSRELDGCFRSVIHGDFSHDNFAFSPDGIAAIYDYDLLTLGLPSEDLALSFALRCRESAVRRADLRCMKERIATMVRLCGWPVEDWHTAIVMERLRLATHEIAEGPLTIGLALKIARRDRRQARMHAFVGGWR